MDPFEPKPVKSNFDTTPYEPKKVEGRDLNEVAKAYSEADTQPGLTYNGSSVRENQPKPSKKKSQ